MCIFQNRANVCTCRIARLLKCVQDFLALSSMDTKESVGRLVLMVYGQSASVAQFVKFFRILMKQLRSSLAYEVPNKMKRCHPKHPHNISLFYEFMRCVRGLSRRKADKLKCWKLKGCRCPTRRIQMDCHEDDQWPPHHHVVGGRPTSNLPPNRLPLLLTQSSSSI